MVGDKLTVVAPVVVPVPLRPTVCGLPVALSVNVIVPGWLPAAVGVKVTLMVQLAPAATEAAAGVGLSVRRAGGDAGDVQRAEAPPLVSVTVCAALVVFTF